VASGCLAGCPCRVSSNRRRSSQLMLVWSLSCSLRDLQGVLVCSSSASGRCIHQVRASSRSFGLPYILHSLTCCQDGFRGFPGPCRRTHSRRMVVQYLHGLGSTSKCVCLRWIRKSSSHGIHPKCAPLPFVRCASSLGKQASRRLEPATARTWAALVVSHHLDGLLRAKACGFVAPRYRFWSSLRFDD